MNYNYIIGRITKDLDLRYTQTGKAMLNIPIACTTGKDETLYMTIKAFDKMAENINKYCKKGELIGIGFAIKNYNYEDSEGKKHYDYNFIANKVTFLGSTNEKKEEHTGKVEEHIEKKEEYKDPFEEAASQITDDMLPF